MDIQCRAVLPFTAAEDPPPRPSGAGCNQHPLRHEPCRGVYPEEVSSRSCHSRSEHEHDQGNGRRPPLPPGVLSDRTHSSVSHSHRKKRAEISASNRPHTATTAKSRRCGRDPSIAEFIAWEAAPNGVNSTIRRSNPPIACAGRYTPAVNIEPKNARDPRTAAVRALGETEVIAAPKERDASSANAQARTEPCHDSGNGAPKTTRPTVRRRIEEPITVATCSSTCTANIDEGRTGVVRSRRSTPASR